MKPSLLALLAAALVSAMPVSAQTRGEGLRLAGDPAARIEWLRTFASQGDDWINDIVPLSGERYLAAGFLNRDDGAAESKRAWRALAAIVRADGSSADNRHYGERGINAFWSAREGADERIAFAGFSTNGSGGGIDALAMVTRVDGAPIADRHFGGAGYDRFTSLAPAGDGYVFVGHSQPAGETRRRLFAVRTDAALEPVWERIIEGPESIAPLYVAATADGGFVVAGGISRGEDSDMLVLKLDGEGREQWRRAVGTPEGSDVNHGLALLADGRIVITGYSQSWGARGNDIVAAILSADGDLLHVARLGGAGDDRPILAKADSSGGVVIVGRTDSAGAGGSDLLIARLAPSGEFEPGVITLGGASADHGTAVHPLADGALLVAGYRSVPGRGEDAFMLRLNGARWDQANPSFERDVR